MTRSHTQNDKNALKPKTTEMTTWTLKSRWFELLNWSFQDGFLCPSADITAVDAVATWRVPVYLKIPRKNKDGDGLSTICREENFHQGVEGMVP